MSDPLAALLLGLVQGLTEFLPVSSTAHLILVQDLLKLDPERFGLSFDVALHLGTALAVLLYFASTWIALGRDVVRGRWHEPLLVIIGTLPAAVAFMVRFLRTNSLNWFVAYRLLLAAAIVVAVAAGVLSP